MVNKIMALSVLLFLHTAKLLGQNVPDGSMPPSSWANFPSPADYSSTSNSISVSSYNYTRTWKPNFKVDDTTGFDLSSTNFVIPVNVSTEYKDGWGSLLQSISCKGYPFKDIISVTDERNLLNGAEYLPYTVPTTSKFQATPFTDQKSFYNTAYPTESDNAYSRTRIFNNSGQSNVTTYAPGANLTGSARGTTSSVRYNVQSSDPIAVLALDANGLPDFVGTTSRGALFSYGNNQLTGKETDGPDGQSTIEWSNIAGQLVCKQVIVSQAFRTSPTVFAYTYYVYNYFGQLAYIITPKAVEIAQASNWNISYSSVSELCFSYKYDQYGNVIEKKVPGKAGVESTVYDVKRRPILSQTPLMAQNGEWHFCVYDSRGLIRYSGMINDAGTRADWQGYALGAPAPSSASANLSAAISAVTNEYSSGSYPVGSSVLDVQEYNYYDSYAFSYGSPMSSRGFDNSNSSLYLSPTTIGVTPIPNTFVPGLLTAKQTKILGGSFTQSWISSVFYYDSYGRQIQTQTLSPWNSTNWDISTIQYNFGGQVVLTVLDHYAWANATKTSTKIVKKISYNKIGNPIMVTIKTDNESSPHYISVYTYDDFDRVLKKEIGGGAEVQNYSYNIRGQLDGINIPYLSSDIVDQHYGSNICYDYGYSKPRYDGSISGLVWRGTSGYQQSYGYNYDLMNRLTAADYVELFTVAPGPHIYTSWSSASNTTHDYSVSNIIYDVNGNIQSMKQRGVGVVGSALQPVDMDNLTYTYASNSNKLLKVDDAVTLNYQLQDFVDDNTTGNDYTYDQDGNLKSDANKGVTDITYNDLDLPLQVTTTSNGVINNIYDATGVLIQKTITFPTGSGVGTNPWIYRYSGPFVYRNDSLLYMLQDEGRARWMHDSLKFKYDFFVKDHLGNVRAVVTSDVSTSASDYLATHEIASASLENLVFSNIGQVRDPRPYSSSGNVSCARLNGNNDSTRIGTSLLLHVMAGDRFNLSCQAYYDTTESSDPDVHADATSMIGSLISTLGSGVGGFGMPGSESGPGGIGPGNTNILEELFSADNYANVYDQLKEAATNSSLPRAYLNYISFDEQMHIIPGKSGAIQIDASTLGHWGSIGVPDDIAVDQNGFIAAYISNEQYSHVYFDNVHVLHYKGRLLDEQHYYPFGLTIRAGSNDPVQNRFLWQGKELQDEVGLQLYDFHARQYDPQIGRFWGIDPADQFPSGYTGMGNDPANQIDPNGCAVGGGSGGGIPHESNYVYPGDIPDIDEISSYTNSILSDGRFNGHSYFDRGMQSFFRDIIPSLEKGAQGGDETDVYNSKTGNNLGTIKDNLPNATTVVNIDQSCEAEAQRQISVLNTKSSAEINAGATAVRANGESYDISAFKNFYDRFSDIPAQIVASEKGAYYNVSFMSNIQLDNVQYVPKAEVIIGNIEYKGVLRPGGETHFDKYRVPNMSLSYLANSSHSYTHIHAISTPSVLTFQYAGSYTNINFHTTGVSVEDRGAATGGRYLDVIVDKKNVYLYDRGSKLITIGR